MADQGAVRPATANLLLTCRPGKTGNVLHFAYTLENRDTVDIYAMHAQPSIDPASGAAQANEQALVVMVDDQAVVTLGKFAAPLPTDRRVAVPVLPLARRLEPGASLEARLEIPLPLVESSPYFADLTLRQHEVIDIKSVAFTIGYWLAGVDGLAAVPADYAPDLFVVATRNTLRSAQRVSQRFPSTGLQIFRRTDAFPRSFPAR